MESNPAHPNVINSGKFEQVAAKCRPTNDNAQNDALAGFSEAMGMMTAAHDDQIQAARKNAEATARLKAGVAKLEWNLDRYLESLRRIGTTRLQRKARRLARIADAWCAATP